MANFTVITQSPEQTRKIGAYLGQLAQGSDIFLLSGNLGTGKTCLVQGIAFGLGVTEYACSPSFMIAREYHGRLKLYHLDLYRLDHIEDIVDIGIDEYFSSDAVCAIEWAEKGSGVLPEHNFTIDIEYLDGDNRSITFIAGWPRYVQLMQKLKATLDKDKQGKWNFQ